MKAPPPLWRDRTFARIWLSYSFSEFGSNITTTLLPLIAAGALHASPFQMGLIATANTLPYLVAGPFIGVITDRLSRRTILISADIARSLILLCGVTAAITGSLRFELLYPLAFGVGLGSVWYDVAHGSYLPFVVSRGRLIGANSYLSTSQSVASTAGPAIAGTVIQVLGTASAIFVSATIYVLSAVLLRSLNRGQQVDLFAISGRRSVISEMWEGMSFVWRHRLLRTLLLRHAGWHLTVGAINSQLILVLVDQLKLTPAGVGATLSIIGLGTVVAAISAGAISRRLGVGRTIVASNVVAATFSPLLVLSGGGAIPSAKMIGIALFAYGFCLITYQVNNASLRQALTHNSMLGRMTAVTRMVTLGTNAVGAVVAGLLAQYAGLNVAISCFVVLGIGMAAKGAGSSELRAIRAL